MTASNLVEAITEFQAAYRAYARLSKCGLITDETAFGEATYVPPMNALCHWDQPLKCLVEVREAIRLAFTERAIMDDIAKAPLTAALDYLDLITGWEEPESGAA